MAEFMDLIEDHFKADITLGFGQPYPISRIEKAVLPFPGVEHVEGWGAVSVDILAPDDSLVEKVSILAPPSDSLLVDPDLVAGEVDSGG